MRRCVLILAGLWSTAVAHAAGQVDAAYESLRNEAHVAKLINEADADIKSHRYEAALKKADEAAALQPGDPVVLNARGAALTELRRFDEAQKDLEAATAADPAAFAPQFNQGEVLFLQKKYADAALVFAKLRAHFSAIPILKYKIYLCLALEKQDDDAREALGQMRYPQDGTAWYFAYAVDRLLAGKNSEAKRLIKVADVIDADESAIYRDTLRDSGLLK